MKREPGAVLLLANGELRDPKGARALARSVSAVLCADGGARHAKTLGLIPDWVVGDMDSLPRPAPKSWKDTVYWCDFDEQRGDLAKALDFARQAGARKVYLAGALGGGLDHELVNLAVLEECPPGLELVVIGGGEARLLGPGLHRPKLPKGRRFSLLAAPRARVTLTGARYGLADEHLRRGSRGLGNRSEGAVVLRVRDGRVWILS
ncbi:MAG: thiamine diphosphokinase [Elusimicrobiota bacterium]|nr:thiamine diphosphokinase [Elusimicrobiota bacterium]